LQEIQLQTMKSPKLILITGLPGSGKTTFARALSAALDIKHLNSDIIRKNIGRWGNYSPTSKSVVYANLLREAEACLERDESVIVDATFYTKLLRDPYEQLAKQYHVPIVWIELLADEEVIRQRVSYHRPDSEADFDVYLKLKADYEPLDVPHLAIASDHACIGKMVGAAKNYLNLFEIPTFHG